MNLYVFNLNTAFVSCVSFEGIFKFICVIFLSEFTFIELHLTCLRWWRDAFFLIRLHTFHCYTWKSFHSTATIHMGIRKTVLKSKIVMCMYAFYFLLFIFPFYLFMNLRKQCTKTPADNLDCLRTDPMSHGSWCQNVDCI